jgi:glucose/arabinose dehydrogenase
MCTLFATLKEKDGVTGTFNRVIRFTALGNRATEEKILVDIIRAGRGLEYSGALAFGPDYKLYITTPYIANAKEQDENTNLTGKVLRINRDGTIPEDNPFPKSPVYTLGHRNTFGIAFDKTTGTGTAITAENDARSNDEINVLKKGGNYGFPATQQQPTSLPSALESLTDNRSDIMPARTYYKTITPAQAIYYDSNKFPILKGKFLLVSYGEKKCLRTFIK